MKLKAKLQRLGPSAPLARSETAGSPPARSEDSRLGRPSVADESSDTKANQLPASSLDTLRAKMDAILGAEPKPGSKASPAPEASHAPTASHSPTASQGLRLRDAERPCVGLGDLPFVETGTRHGKLTQRLERQRPSACVGRIPLTAALAADMNLLSLLALSPGLSGLDPKCGLFFDTETTGLGGAGTVAFLVGMAWFEDGEPMLEQQLLASPADEVALLQRFRHLVEKADFLVSYNGKSFDWPLLQSRCVMNHLPELPQRPHLDLLHVARRLHKRRLERFRLIHLESEVLGWQRNEDDIPGAEIAPRYGHFLRSGDAGALSAVIDHNAWDVLSMVALVGLYGEPLSDMHASDLIGVSETLLRAKAHERALSVAERVVHGAWGSSCCEQEQGRGRASEGPLPGGDRPVPGGDRPGLGGEAEGLKVRARSFKALGDRARALADFEALSIDVDDPQVRLELAKLYEHHAKDYARALAVVDRGTGEDVEAACRRRNRLERKANKAR